MRATDRTTKEPISTAKSTPTKLEEQPGNQQSGPDIQYWRVFQRNAGGGKWKNYRSPGRKVK